MTETISCACCTRTVIGLLLDTLLWYCYHPLCLCRLRRWFFYLFNYCYVCTSLSLYCILFRRFLISKINVALQLTKLLLKKFTTTTTTTTTAATYLRCSWIVNQIKKRFIAEFVGIFLNLWIFGKVTSKKVIVSCTFFVF